MLHDYRIHKLNTNLCAHCVTAVMFTNVTQCDAETA